MAELEVQSGAISFTSASADGDYFENNGQVKVIIKNTGSDGAEDVIFDSQMPCQYGYDHDKEVTVEEGDTYITNTFSTNRFNDEDGYVQIEYSDESVFEIAVISA